MNTPVVGDSGFMIFFFSVLMTDRYTRFSGNISAINNIFSFFLILGYHWSKYM